MGVKILRVHWLGPSTNALKGKHWSEYNKYKKAALVAVQVAIKQQWPGRTTLTFPVKITIRPYLGKGKREYDLINYAPSYKMIEDSLVELTNMPDDRVEYVSAFEIQRPVKFDNWYSAEHGHKQSFIMVEIKPL